MIERDEPAYDLDMVGTMFAAGRFVLTVRVAKYLRHKRWQHRRIRACAMRLTSEDFHKSQEHRDRPGVWLDIYRPRYPGERLYIKFVFDQERGVFLVLSFCLDGEAH